MQRKFIVSRDREHNVGGKERNFILSKGVSVIYIIPRNGIVVKVKEIPDDGLCCSVSVVSLLPVLISKPMSETLVI